jgi:hypothetical protein
MIHRLVKESTSKLGKSYDSREVREECNSRLSWFWGLDEQKTSLLNLKGRMPLTLILVLEPV